MVEPASIWATLKMRDAGRSCDLRGGGHGQESSAEAFSVRLRFETQAGEVVEPAWPLRAPASCELGSISLVMSRGGCSEAGRDIYIL